MIWPINRALALWRGRPVVVEPPPLPATMLTPHFALAELGCRDGLPVPEPLRRNARLICEQLEVLRVELARPIRIVSGWRSAAHNARVGSTEASQHRIALAADIVVAGVDPGEVADVLERLIAQGRVREGGVGRYLGFTHLDARGTRARWGV